MDLALAHAVARKLAASGTQLDAVADARADPRLPRRQGDACSPTPTLAAAPVVVPGRGSKLIGGSHPHRADARRRCTRRSLDGFFPRVAASDAAGDAARAPA